MLRTSQAREKALRPHSKRRKARSFLRKWKQISFKHTWINPLILILIVLSAYAVNPTASNPVHKAIFLSYALPPEHRYPLDPPKPLHQHDGPTMYGKGPHDITFVAFYTIVLSFTREFLMQRLIRPLALYCGIRGRNKQSRFMEV
jgi:acyl-CoA-dependent ceramide synthase